MLDISKYKQILLSGGDNFNELAFLAFHHQYNSNEIYHEFCTHLKIDPSNVNKLEEIPFLPIEFFKTHTIATNATPGQTIFESSGTTGSITSKHFVNDLEFYLNHSYNLFSNNYKKSNDKALFFLLPSYLERSNSSLVAMADFLLKNNKNELSGFFLDDFKDLEHKIKTAISNDQEIILLGVTFGLLDFVDSLKNRFSYDKIKIIETGGMKGRKKEMTRHEAHSYILNKMVVNTIHSEYGMTELLSQSYSNGNGVFKPNHAFKPLIREITDPLNVNLHGKGGLNIIDLANIESCSFIATQDQGEVFNDNNFTISGRIDHSDIRGCNLMSL